MVMVSSFLRYDKIGVVVFTTPWSSWTPPRGQSQRLQESGLKQLVWTPCLSWGACRVLQVVSWLPAFRHWVACEAGCFLLSFSFIYLLGLCQFLPDNWIITYGVPYVNILIQISFVLYCGYYKEYDCTHAHMPMACQWWRVFLFGLWCWWLCVVQTDGDRAGRAGTDSRDTGREQIGWLLMIYQCDRLINEWITNDEWKIKTTQWMNEQTDEVFV